MIIYCHAVLIALSFETSRVIIIIAYHKIREMVRLNNLSSHTPVIMKLEYGFRCSIPEFMLSIIN